MRFPAVDTGPYSPVRAVQTVLDLIIPEWAGTMLRGFHRTGTFMKGTANNSGTDIDRFTSITERTTDTLRDISQKLERLRR